MSQALLARRVGVSQQTIARLVSGDAYGSRYMHKIARELRTTSAFLMGETDDPDSEAPDEPPISNEERELIELFRSIDEKDRSAIVQLARSLANSARSPSIHEKGLDYRAGASRKS